MLKSLLVLSILISRILSFAFDLNKTVECNIRYYFYHGSMVTAYNVSNFASLFNHSKFYRDKPTTFYIYGTMEGIWVPTVIAVKDAYLANGKQNFVIVGNLNPFLHVFINAPVIADKFSTNMIQFIRAGYDMSKVTFVSFSLGSKSIAPLTSRLIRKKSGGRLRLQRIVALDPGIIKDEELYLVGGRKLNEDDAKFVMTVHTDCHYWGTKESHGHVNFWVNGGCDQPMCHNDFTKSICNHIKAPLYWAEAVRSDSKKSFKSRQCTSYKCYLKKDCDLSLPVAYISLYTPSYTRGNYYVRTKKVAPYSRS
ncbi:hypothetical protein PVAND_014190 [Polypedilum vanderplanki]|uniref:Lipase domain-containing protein n=1 Tax=Polypedilum vanderplanki TaxID=319348 RepID=A0A9J6CTJ0_POLVA|nr:hypothetical protein PVAND_014190 [Polypedilum vanderplanki]